MRIIIRLIRSSYQSSPKFYIFLALGFNLFIGFAIRALLVARPQQYWVDEIFSLYISRFSETIPNLIKFLQVGEYHPPLYYFLMFYWTRIFGISEVSTRSVSMIFGVLSLIVFYKLARKLFSLRVSLLALFLLSINPLHVEYSVQARPYTLMTFFGLISAYLLILLIEKRNWYLWLFFIISNILGLYTHYSYLFIFSSFVVFLIYGRLNHGLDKKIRFSSKEIFFFLSFVFILFLPWLPTFIGRYFDTYENIANDLEVAGYSEVHSEKLISSLFWLVKYPLDKFSFILITLGKLAILFLFTPLMINYKEKRSWKLFLLGCWFIFPIVLFLMSNYSLQYSEIIARHIMFSVFPLCLLAGYCFFIVRINAKRIIIFILFLVSLLVSLCQVSVNSSAYNPYYRAREIASYLQENEKKGDLVLTSSHLFLWSLSHYYKGQNKIVSYFPIKNPSLEVDLSNGPFHSLQTRYMVHTKFLTQENYQDLSSVIGDHERAWLVYAAKNINFMNFFIDNNWRLKEIAPLENTYPVYLFEK